MRAAYLVLPQVLVEPFIRAKALADGFTAPFVQAVLADFIGEGHFAVHLRRMRERYRERRDAFRSAAVDHLPPYAVLGPAEAGIHVALELPDGIDDQRLSERALSEGLALPALSTQSIDAGVRGLLVHYGHVPVPKLDSATRRLARVLEWDRLGRT